MHLWRRFSSPLCFLRSMVIPRTMAVMSLWRFLHSVRSKGFVLFHFQCSSPFKIWWENYMVWNLFSCKSHYGSSLLFLTIFFAFLLSKKLINFISLTVSPFVLFLFLFFWLLNHDSLLFLFFVSHNNLCSAHSMLFNFFPCLYLSSLTSISNVLSIKSRKKLKKNEPICDIEWSNSASRALWMLKERDSYGVIYVDLLTFPLW